MSQNIYKELKEQALQVCEGMRVDFPQYHHKSKLSIASALIPDHERTWCMNNGTVAFIIEREMFVAHYTKKLMRLLDEAGFSKAGFQVPFSNWDYPIDFKHEWDKLYEQSLIQRDLEYKEDCEKYCLEHGIGKLSDELLENCFKVPKAGVRYRHLGNSSYFRPDRFNIQDLLGRFCTNNGTIVFYHADGEEFITRKWEVIPALLNAGYIKSDLYVPLSNGEEIVDETLAARWATLAG